MITSVIAAVQGVLDNIDRYTEDKIIGAMEDDPILLKPDDLRTWTVVAKTHESEWSLFSVRQAVKDEGLEWNEFNVPTEDGELVVTDVTNALSHADALLHCMAYATNIL